MRLLLSIALLLGLSSTIFAQGPSQPGPITQEQQAEMNLFVAQMVAKVPPLATASTEVDGFKILVDNGPRAHLAGNVLIVVLHDLTNEVATIVEYTTTNQRKVTVAKVGEVPRTRMVNDEPTAAAVLAVQNIVRRAMK